MKERGFTLVEMMVALLIIGLGMAALAGSFLGRSKRMADLEAVKSLIDLAARRSVVEARHFGVHFDSTLHTAGLFEDRNNDDRFNGTDTLSSVARLYPLSKLKMTTSGSASLADICFKKNGSTSSGNSFELKYIGSAGDTTRLQVIAASGRILGI
jgi:prepilin-type N-terminal cleavage/methylation domain-containing protein